MADTVARGHEKFRKYLNIILGTMAATKSLEQCK